MKLRSITSVVLRTTSAVLVLLATNSMSVAQTSVISEATAFLESKQEVNATCFLQESTLKDKPAWVIELVFTSQLTKKDVDFDKDADHYALFDITNKKAIPIRGVCVDVGNAIVMLNVNPDDLKKDGLYHLYVLKLSFDGTPIKKPISTVLGFGADATGSPSNKPAVKAEKANGRDDSNIYVSGELQRASGSDFVGAADIKLSYPILREIAGSTNRFTPFFDLKGSSDPKSDNDTLNVGIEWAWVKSISNPLITDRIWKNTIKTESNRDFRNTNFVFESRWVLPLKMPAEFTTEHFVMTLDPFFGIEVGKNLKSLLEQAEGSGIARPMIGATFYLAFPIGGAGLDEISLEANHIRRWPLKQEVTFDLDKDKKPILASFGTSPRDHVDAKLNFNFTKAFGAFVGYEYGRLPPLYKLVDHNMKIGFTYKVKLVRKKQ